MGYVKGRTLSKGFRICRGTKQGDPLSPALFNALLERIMSQLKQKWQRKQWGIQVGTQATDILTNLRFADDIFLLARTKYQVTHMLEDLMLAAKSVGLEIHTGKTKFLSTEVTTTGSVAKVLDNAFAIVTSEGATEYLGRQLSFHTLHDTELQHRIDKAWKKFFANKPELCCKHIPIKT
eukprot:3682445-Karenia_brevis.AAC.1